LDTTTIILIVVAVLVIAAIAYLVYQNQQRSKLKDKFGPEYERTVERRDDRREAEAELREREKKRDELEVRPLSDGARTRFQADWDRVEAGFIEDPDGAARDGDRIVAEVMRERGYPVEGRDHTDVLSVDHPGLVERYRSAMRTAGDPRSASTEDLRKALLDLRATFDELVHDHGDGRDDTRNDEETRDGTR
jgi:hypothetical protein